jgi:hypothetical protein
MAPKKNPQKIDQKNKIERNKIVDLKEKKEK